LVTLQLLFKALKLLTLFAQAGLQVCLITRQQRLALLHIDQGAFGRLTRAARLRQLGLASFDLGETLLQLRETLLMVPLQLLQRGSVGDLQGLLSRLPLPARVQLSRLLPCLLQLLLELLD